MSKNWKNQIFIYLILILLSGCGGGGGESPNIDQNITFPINNSSTTDEEQDEEKKYIVYTQSDLNIINTKLVDIDGKDIDYTNRYEAGDNITLEITIENTGTESIPVQDNYFYCTTVDDSESCYTAKATELKIQLEPNEVNTFIFKTSKKVGNNDHEKLFNFSINVATGSFTINNTESIFLELRTSNNGFNNLKIPVYQTSLSISDIAIGIHNGTNFIEKSIENPIDISEDNIEGNYVQFCYKVKNVGEYNFIINDDSRVIFNTEAFGDGLYPFFEPSFSLNVNEESETTCGNIELPFENLVAGDYTYEAVLTSYTQDLNTSDNNLSVKYKIID